MVIKYKLNSMIVDLKVHGHVQIHSRNLCRFKLDF